MMSDCGCDHEATNPKERKVLQIALALNAAMGSGTVVARLTPALPLESDTRPPSTT